MHGTIRGDRRGFQRLTLKTLLAFIWPLTTYRSNIMLDCFARNHLKIRIKGLSIFDKKKGLTSGNPFGWSRM